ncbi:hypothetical protein DKX38_006525 [Salix brachista]|uniref:Uncharacterized protein n=1 Tax=Salix brachista TaxID=2182728 RepID=A0A5N5N3K5_9ROSI|nr:hypothetical protein DKX38_006525 [Salix brachista]
MIVSVESLAMNSTGLPSNPMKSKTTEKNSSISHNILQARWVKKKGVFGASQLSFVSCGLHAAQQSRLLNRKHFGVLFGLSHHYYASLCPGTKEVPGTGKERQREKGRETSLEKGSVRFERKKTTTSCSPGQGKNTDA